MIGSSSKCSSLYFIARGSTYMFVQLSGNEVIRKSVDILCSLDFGGTRIGSFDSTR